MKLSELYWYRITPLHFLLWPLSVLYTLFLSVKKLCYWLDIIPSVKLPVPVIIVDSISVDDSGKTPLLFWLVDSLRAQGFSPGIITRGNSDNPGSPVAVTSASDPYSVGSKTFLLAQHFGSSCPVWVGNDRIAVAQALLNVHPECNIIICNDGLDYYRLERDIEVTVIDFSEQSFGNGMVLPAGPLRMNFNNLTKASLIVTGGNHNPVAAAKLWDKTYNMKLINEMAYNVLNPENQQAVSNLKALSLHAVTDAENAHWFFDSLQKAGLNAELHSYAENHRFKPEEILFSDADVVLMPEENAVQCREFVGPKLWALPRKAWVNSELQTILFKKLGYKPGSDKQN